MTAGTTEGLSSSVPWMAVVRHPWSRFAVRRLGRLVVSLCLLVVISFLMVHVIPGDPVRAALGLNAPQGMVDARRDALGLNDPIHVQFWGYVSALFRGDLGSSMTNDLPVATVIGDRLPATLMIGVLAFGVVLLIAIPLGLAMAALTRGGRRRGVELTFVGTGIVLWTIPEFVMAVGLVYVFGVELAWFPVAGRHGPESYVLPVLALALGPGVMLARIMRVEALRVLDEDFVRTARAKRLSRARIYGRHVFPNALTAMLTIGGLLLSGMLIGTVLIEAVFAWPGLGTTIVSSIIQKDYPVVQAVVLVYGAAVLIVNTLVDVALGLVDPRSAVRES